MRFLKITFIFLFFSCAKFCLAQNYDCKTHESSSNSCVFLVKGKAIASIFPLNTGNLNISWNNLVHDPEFSWSTELGFCEKNGFRGVGYEFAAYNRNMLGEKEKKNGNLKDLINSGDLNFSLYSTSPVEMEREFFDLRYRSSSFTGDIFRDDFFIIMSNDLKVYDKLISENATHALMRFKSPYKEISYECISEIHRE